MRSRFNDWIARLNLGTFEIASTFRAKVSASDSMANYSLRFRYFFRRVSALHDYTWFECKAHFNVNRALCTYT